MSYYQLPRISNSDLTIAAHILQGIPYEKPETTFRLGGAFHELLLEPEKFRTESCEGLNIRTTLPDAPYSGEQPILQVVT